jgi:hypothetical protein
VIFTLTQWFSAGDLGWEGLMLRRQRRAGLDLALRDVEELAAHEAARFRHAYRRRGGMAARGTGAETQAIRPLRHGTGGSL